MHSKTCYTGGSYHLCSIRTVVVVYVSGEALRPVELFLLGETF